MVSMPRRIAIAVAVLLVMVFRFADAASPNVVIILADDVGYGDIRANNPASVVATPAIDRLASEGLRFTDAHAGSKCAPSRYILMTGQYPWRGRYPYGQWGYLGGSAMRDGQETIGGLAQRAGYVTGYVGKSHLGGDFYRKGSNAFATVSAPDADVDFARGMRNGFGPNGWDESFALLRGIQASPYAYFRNDELVGDAGSLVHWPVGKTPDTRINNAGIGMPDWSTRDVGRRLIQDAERFIADNADEPFLLLLNTHAMHVPIFPGPDYLGVSGLGKNVDMLLEFDGMVGRVVAALEREGKLDDTVVIVTSDNGANPNAVSGHDSSGGRRGSKGSIYEGGHRVPFVVRWGSNLGPGTVSPALVGLIDVYATLADILDVPMDAETGADSISLLPILTGQAATVRKSMVHESRDQENGFSQIHYAFREPKWKLIVSGGAAVELYNMAVDPAETTNVIANHPIKVPRMLADFKAARASVSTRDQ